MLDRASVTDTINRLNRHMSLPVHLVAHERFGDFPPVIQEEAEHKGIPERAIRAAVIDSKVHINAGAFDSQEDLEEAIDQALVGEYGLHTVYGRPVREALSQLYDRVGGDLGFESLVKEQSLSLATMAPQARFAGNRPARETALAEHLLGRLARHSDKPVRQARSGFMNTLRHWWSEHGFERLSNRQDATIGARLGRQSRTTYRPLAENREQRPSTLVLSDRPEDWTHSARRQGVSKTEAAGKLNEISRRLGADIGFKLFETQEQLPRHIRDHAREHYPNKPINGVFDAHTQTGYVVLENLHSLEHLERVIFEEAYGHLGLKRLFQGQTHEAMVGLYQAIGGAEGLGRLADKHGIDLQAYASGLAEQLNNDRIDEQTYQSIMMEEFLAHLAQDQNPSIRRRVQETIGQMRHWFRGHRFSQLANVNDSDLRYLLKSARHALNTDRGVDDRSMMFVREPVLPPEAQVPPLQRHLIGDNDLVGAWTLLSMNDEAFSFPTSRATDLKQVFDDLLTDDGKALVAERYEDMDNGDTKVWRIRDQDNPGRYGLVFEQGQSVWIDVLEWGAGAGGSHIYNAVANYAYNTHRVFVGDPDGLSELSGMTRRLENMLSSALKFGTTDHLDPHPDQLVGNRFIPPLDWKTGDTAHNIDALLKTSLTSVEAQVPGIRNVRYNGRNDTFRNTETGEEIDYDDLESATDTRRDSPAREGSGQTAGEHRSTEPDGRAAGRADNPGADPGVSQLKSWQRARGQTSAGGRTLARAIVSRSISQGTSEEQSQILERIGLQRAESLNRILYNLGPSDAGAKTPQADSNAPPTAPLPYPERTEPLDDNELLGVGRAVLGDMDQAYEHNDLARNERLDDYALTLIEALQRRTDSAAGPVRESLEEISAALEANRLGGGDPQQPPPAPHLARLGWIDDMLAEGAGERFQFAGPSAATASEIALNAARQFHREGVAIDTIREKTGWFLGEDSRWRFEISDDQAQLSTIGQGAFAWAKKREQPIYKRFQSTLGEILFHPTLFAAYPELRKTKVKVDTSYGDTRTASLSLTDEPLITLYTDDPDQAIRSTLHEIQHLIQEIEGFNRGGAQEQLEGTYARALEKRFKTLVEREQHLTRLPAPSDLQRRELDLVRAERLAVSKTQTRVVRGQMDQDFFDNYKNLAGEREARLVQRDQHLNAHEREQREPRLPQEQGRPIVVFNKTLGIEQAGDMRFSAKGSTRLLPTHSVIRLGEAADKSTFFHESAHVFLNLEAHTAEATDTLDPVQTQILEWFAIEGFDQMSREHEEMFARGFEQFLIEREQGEQPKIGPQGAFRTAKRWLGSVYRSFKDDQVPLSDTARSIFEQMITPQEPLAKDQREQAREHERTLAKQLQQTGFYTPRQAKVCAHVFGAYARAKSQRDPHLPTVDRVYDRMGLTIERAEPAAARFDPQRFDIQALVERQSALFERKQQRAGELASLDLSELEQQIGREAQPQDAHADRATEQAHHIAMP